MDSFLSFFYLSLPEWIVAGVFTLFFLIQLLFYLLLYRKPYVYAKKTVSGEEILSDEQLPSVSVIIVSKNESENIRTYLPSVLKQDYPDFEVIVVNMGSTDDTDMELKALEQSHDNLYQTYVPANAEPINERKLALTIGVKAAKKDILLFTNADCQPLSDQWIKSMARRFVPGKDIVLGYARLAIDKSVSMRRYIEFDNVWMAIRYLSMAIIKRPFMGIGKNLAYRKSLFFSKKGFSSILNMEYGEDDLFVNRLANKSNTSVELSPESMVESNVVERFSTWRAIKSAYVYNQQFYRGSDRFLRVTELFTRYGFYFLFVLILAWSIVQADYVLLALSVLLFIVRFLIQYFIINGSSRLLQARNFSWRIFIYDIIQPIINRRFKKYAQRKSIKRK